MSYQNLWEYALENGWHTTENPEELNRTSSFGILCTMVDNIETDNSYLLGYTMSGVPSNLRIDASLPLEEQVAFFNAFFGAVGLS